MIAYEAQLPYDQRLGMPRRLERHPLALRNGERKWIEHLRARGIRVEG